MSETSADSWWRRGSYSVAQYFLDFCTKPTSYKCFLCPGKEPNASSGQCATFQTKTWYSWLYICSGEHNKHQGHTYRTSTKKLGIRVWYFLLPLVLEHPKKLRKDMKETKKVVPARERGGKKEGWTSERCKYSFTESALDVLKSTGMCQITFGFWCGLGTDLLSTFPSLWEGEGAFHVQFTWFSGFCPYLKPLLCLMKECKWLKASPRWLKICPVMFRQGRFCHWRTQKVLVPPRAAGDPTQETWVSTEPVGGTFQHIQAALYHLGSI